MVPLFSRLAGFAKNAKTLEALIYKALRAFGHGELGRNPYISTGLGFSLDLVPSPPSLFFLHLLRLGPCALPRVVDGGAGSLMA